MSLYLQSLSYPYRVGSDCLTQKNNDDMKSQILPLSSHTWLVEIRKVTENGLQTLDYCKCTTYNAAEMQARIYSVRILNESDLADAFVVVKPYEMKRYVYAR